MSSLSSLDKLFPPTQRAAVRQPIEKARTLPRAAFVDEAFYRLEQRSIFFNGWMSLGFAAEVPSPGDLLPRVLAGAPLLLTRDIDGELHVLHNVCPRDNCLAVLEPARGLSEIVGPYHGWRWRLNGALIDATLYDGTCREHSFDDGRFDLQPVHHAIWQGVVFVNFAGDPESFDSYIAPVTELYANVDLSPLGTALSASGQAATTWLHFDANWKTVYDNFAININHEAFVHPLYDRAPNVPRVDQNGNRQFEEIDDRGYQGLRFRQTEAEQIYGPPTTPVLHRHDGSPLDEYTIMTLYPNTNISLFPDHLCISVLLPDGPAATDYLTGCRLIGDKATLADYAELRTGLLGAWLGAAEEDARICAAVQAGRESPAFDQHLFVPFWERLYHSFSQRIVNDLERHCC